MKQSIIIDSGSNGHGMNYPIKGDKELVITHNAGFFSCCTIALQDLITFHRHYKQLPKSVNRSSQYSFYKHNAAESLIRLFFQETDSDIPFKDWYELHYDAMYETQFADYKKINFEAATPFVNKYFNPSQHVRELVEMYETKYNIDYDNTCAILYRGNDKVKECRISPYNDFINKATEYANCRYFVLPDELEFLEEFQAVHPNSFYLEETPNIRRNKETANFYEIPTVDRAGYAAKFLAGIIVASKCKNLITHSGNVSLWCLLFRGHTNGVNQWRDGLWIY